MSTGGTKCLPQGGGEREGMAAAVQCVFFLAAGTDPRKLSFKNGRK